MNKKLGFLPYLRFTFDYDIISIPPELSEWRGTEHLPWKHYTDAKIGSILTIGLTQL